MNRRSGFRNADVEFEGREWVLRKFLFELVTGFLGKAFSNRRGLAERFQCSAAGATDLVNDALIQ